MVNQSRSKVRVVRGVSGKKRERKNQKKRSAQRRGGTEKTKAEASPRIWRPKARGAGQEARSGKARAPSVLAVSRKGWRILPRQRVSAKKRIARKKVVRVKMRKDGEGVSWNKRKKERAWLPRVSKARRRTMKSKGNKR
jgi:hypothetical protein